MTAKDSLAIGDIWYSPRHDRYRLITSLTDHSVSYVWADVQDTTFGSIALVNDTVESTCNPHTFSRWAIQRIDVVKVYVDFDEMLRLYREAASK